ncbi:MAG: DUF3488 and transglutaminase-like domain-containing protein [Planctomycetota bacterium]|nr:DUF3488 and transglutaminase-like domain-containing protein [Planctomycetota bacterium]
MNSRAGRARALLACCAISLIAYAAASPTPEMQALAILLGAVGLVVSSPLIGLRLPRWVAGLATLAVLLYTLNRTLAEGLGVHQFAAFVTWMIVVKLFDRRHPGDDAQLLAYSIFLALAAVIVSNGLLVGVLTISYLPLLAYAAMYLQLQLALSKAERLAGKGVPRAHGRPPVRAVAGAGVGGSLRRTSLFAIALGLVVAGFVFVIVPRGAGLRQIGQLGNPSAGRLVSFSDRVRVGSGGTISMSRRPVLHLALRNAAGEPMGGRGAVKYLRGAALDRYEDGTWFSSGSPDAIGTRQEVIAEQAIAFGASGGQAGLYQEITLLATPDDFTYLFAIWRPTKFTPLDPGQIAHSARDGTAMVNSGGGKYRYVIRSSLIEPSIRRRTQRQPTSWDSEVVSQVAAEILLEAGIEPDPNLRPIDDDDRAIIAFRRHFWDNYTYSLGEPPPPSGVEPTEWFLTGTDRGHCEHYASGLAALCRSVGIPARVVTGYLAAEYNRSTHAYVVRESNAHAWVEAQGDPGLWKTYDATPPSELTSLHGPAPGLLARAGRLLDTLNYAWVNSIVSFDRGSRSELLSLDSPRTQELSEKADEVLGAMRTASVKDTAVLAVKIFAGIVGSILLGVLGVVLVRRWRVWWSRRPGAIPRRIADADARARVVANPIYQEMLGTLARSGITKPEWQPPCSWSEALGASTSTENVAPVVAELVELYYVIRFGGRELSRAQLVRARELLDALKSAASRAA